VLPIFPFPSNEDGLHGDCADHCLTSRVDVNVLNSDALLPGLTLQSLHGFELFAEDSHQARGSEHVPVDHIGVLVLSNCAAEKVHRGIVGRNHLSGEHRLCGVLLTSELRPANLRAVLADQYRWWSVHIDYFQSKTHFLRYAGRYARRPPIAQHRFEKITDTTVRFSLKDKRLKRRVSSECSPAEFVALLAEHVPDRYRHAVRYFGLLAPRSKRQTAKAILLLLSQQARPRPRRLGWAFSMRRDFGVDPLIDEHGQPMRCVGRLSPPT
jgi:hypothetical protein